MISRYNYRGLTWVDIESPTREEVQHILEEFTLPEHLGEEMFSSTFRSKVDLYDDLVYLILHFPAGHGKHVSTEQEVDFIIGKNFIITIHYEIIDALHDFSKTFETKALRDTREVHAGLIFMEIIKTFYRRSLHDLEDLTKRIRDIEEHIFSGKEEAMVKRISHVQRKLLDFKQAIRFHGDILHSYENTSHKFFGDDYKYYASVITAEYNKVSSMLEGNRELLSELQRTNDSLLSTKSNEIMKMFTIMTFVMVPLSIITGVFGMNTSDSLVFIQDIRDFAIVIGAMLLLALLMFFIFRFRRWL